METSSCCHGNRAHSVQLHSCCLPVMGDLQKVLDKGEYIPLKYAPVFESNFVQVNSRGESIYLHNRPNYVTMGICASSRNLSLPNVMLLAHVSPASSQEDISAEQMCTRQSCSEDELVITRFLPLKFVDLSVYNAKKRHFKLTLVNGRAYYLELCAPPHKQSQLFRQWVRLISVLKSKSKYSAVNALYKDFNTPDENRAIRSNKVLGFVSNNLPAQFPYHCCILGLPFCFPTCPAYPSHIHGFLTFPHPTSQVALARQHGRCGMKS
uniref:Golgi associated RAB2 interactor protein-like Rab2B-binding domain-containing protein n=1 Tax=Salvator merianae TaxID=96440 RepID=A0A8D0BR39_SALMN